MRRPGRLRRAGRDSGQVTAFVVVMAAARVQGGTAAAGQQRAQQVISQIGSSVLVGPQVSVTMTPADVTVTVTGTAERVVPLPGLSFPVSVTVTGPVEQFVPATAQG